MPVQAAYLHAALTAVVVAFQAALAAGMPWGEFAMGGASPGVLPPTLRQAAVIQAMILTVMSVVVLGRAGVLRVGWVGRSQGSIWLVVALMSVSLLLNLASPSAAERTLWVPVAAVMWACALVVAMRSR